MSCVAEYGSAQEEVVLLDDDGNPIGQQLKSAAHHSETPFHLAFSLFLFDRNRRFLAQRRALRKKTWPGVWSNSCCGHPAPGEAWSAAVNRRLNEELGLDVADLQLALPEFRYRACWEDIWENELCPVFIGFCESAPILNADEVHDVAWVSWDAFAAVCASPKGSAFENYSPWSLMEARELRESDVLERALSRWQSD